MNYNEFTVDQLEERAAAILTEIEADGADLDALETEARAIKAELEERKKAEEQRAAVREEVAKQNLEVIEAPAAEERKMANIEIRNTKEYIDAYAEYIRTGNDAECRALTSTNDTTPNGTGTVAVPDFVYDIVKTAWEREGIMSRVRKSYLKGNLKVGFEISGSDAAVHTEGAAAVSEETLVLGTVSLIPASIKKWIKTPALAA